MFRDMTISWYQLLFIVVLVAVVPTNAKAELPCGNIIALDGWVDGSVYSNSLTTTPIVDCANPFNKTVGIVSPYTLTIEGVDVADNGQVVIPEGGAIHYETTGYSPSPSVFTEHVFFKHDGNDYRYVNTEEIEPTEADLRRLATEFFGPGVDIEPYIAAMLSDDPWNYFPEGEQQDLLYSFDDYIYNHPVLPPLLPGVYTLVSREHAAYVTQLNWYQKLFASLIPTAQAQSDEANTFTLTFTLVAEPPAPTGASSILFLPGIQASRLYMDGALGTEDRVWPPNGLFNNDVRALTMNLEGISKNDIYTRDIIDTATGVGDVYSGFESFLTNLKSQNLIDNWTPFAYDWRYSVTDIVENGTMYEEGIHSAIEEVESLALSSLSGQVTIVGHSNGGLLAKAIMSRLENEGKANLVDKVIFLASPQLGTPKAIGTILHGYDQTDKLGGIIINGQTAREVINNMPGAYGLLPSEDYFNGLNEPIVTFVDSESTAPYRAVYGSSISNYTDFANFIRGEDGLNRDIQDPVSVPARANGAMLDNALLMHDTQLDNWVAPAGVEVIEIVGTGLPTMKSVEYRENIEDKCITAGPAGIVCTPESEIKPYALLTRYGDGTVLQRSAEGYGGEKTKYFLNLELLNIEIEGQGQKSIFHHNITETPPIQDLSSSLLLGTTTIDNEFVSSSYTEFSNEYDIEMIDSPVRFLATDILGNQTGIVLVDGVETVKEDIPGSQYFELGGTKYFVVPKGTNRTTKLYGEDYGGYTLTTALLGGGDTQIIQTQLENASTTPDLIAEYSNTDGAYGSIVTDTDGDGEADVETTLDGVLLEHESEDVTYDVFIDAIKNSGLSKKRLKPLLAVVQKAEFYSKKSSHKKTYEKLENVFLKLTTKTIKHYVRKKYLTEEVGERLLEMAQELNDNHKYEKNHSG